METTQESAIAALLRETEAAHGAYDTDILGGVFDEDWAAWYAKYLLDHRLGDHLPGTQCPDVETLTAMLTRFAADYEREENTGPWPDVYARGIISMLTAPPGSPHV